MDNNLWSIINFSLLMDHDLWQSYLGIFKNKPWYSRPAEDSCCCKRSVLNRTNSILTCSRIFEIDTLSGFRNSSDFKYSFDSTRWWYESIGYRLGWSESSMRSWSFLFQIQNWVKIKNTVLNPWLKNTGGINNTTNLRHPCII